MDTRALLVLALACACASRQTPATDPSVLNAPPPTNVSVVASAALFRGTPVQAVLPCDAKLYYRLDGLTSGERLTVRLHAEAGGNYRFCHHGAFPDAHDQYTYTDLRGCAAPGAPSDVTAEAVADGPTLYVRVWRDGPAGEPGCIPARVRLTVN